jgi:hypothetical protein
MANIDITKEEICLMANIDITKEEICLMANNTFNIDEIDELEPQSTFDELQNAFEELFHYYLKSCKKKSY